MNNDEGVIGVAPGVLLYIVRVFADNCNWSYSSNLVDAVNRCSDAGSHIISMSLGGGGASSTEETAFDNIAGTTISIAAAGNDGNTVCSYPASYPSVVSVAAVDSTGTVASFSQQNSQVEIAAPGVGVKSTISGSGSASYTSSLTVPNLDVSTWAFESAGSANGTLIWCDLAIGSGKPRDRSQGDCENGAVGKICLIARGTETFANKASYCEGKGGVGAIIYNNEAGALSGVTIGSYSGIPVVGISDTDGSNILDMIRTSPIPAEVDVTSISAGPYANYDGTSMATPHVSGVAALVWSNHANCTATEIRNALVCNADRYNSSDGHSDDYGYGIVKAKAASDALALGSDCDGCRGNPPTQLSACGGSSSSSSGCAAESAPCKKKNCEMWRDGCCCPGLECGGKGSTGTCSFP